jgi:hypothetical protein
MLGACTTPDVQLIHPILYFVLRTSFWPPVYPGRLVKRGYEEIVF